MKPDMKGRASTMPGAGRLAGAAVIGYVLLTAGGALHAADTFKGRQLYTTNCVTCHGATGKSVIPGAPNLGLGDGMMRPDFTLLNAIRSGKNAMPAFRGILSDRDIMDVIAYMRTLH
ncbi:c-type cytochrome [Polaromonas sp.]|uniref:c-type cytochrome n=1 Tax=Polaromonas sp. TaxID=1869339 RepID=UPI0018051CAC|nr:c-type cytochrome [Polaromonas sp.]NMM05005.1 cytochrome c [Polaromonas sp.]